MPNFLNKVFFINLYYYAAWAFFWLAIALLAIAIIKRFIFGQYIGNIMLVVTLMMIAGFIMPSPGKLKEKYIMNTL